MSSSRDGRAVSAGSRVVSNMWARMAMLGVFWLSACGDETEPNDSNAAAGSAGLPSSAAGTGEKGSSGGISGATSSGGVPGQGGTGGQATGTSGGSSGSGGTEGSDGGRGGADGSSGDANPEAGAPTAGQGDGASGSAGEGGMAGSGAGGAGQAGDNASGDSGDGGGGDGGEAGAGACHDLLNDGPPRTEWTVDGWFSDDRFTAPLEDLPGERDLYALFVDTGTDGETGRLLRSKVLFRDVLADPISGSFDVVEQYDDGSAEQRASYAFETTGPDTARVELSWLCGDRLPFFEDYSGVLTFIVDFQVVFTRDADSVDPMVSRDYRTREEP